MDNQHSEEAWKPITNKSIETMLRNILVVIIILTIVILW